jgi:hypothetical protein
LRGAEGSKQAGRLKLARLNGYQVQRTQAPWE